MILSTIADNLGVGLRTAVACRKVQKEFGQGDTRTLALRGVDVHVETGKMTLLVGPSGCGKTTLISLIAGLLNPTAGEVMVLGYWLHRMSESDLVRFRQGNIGFVFQQYCLLPTLTAVENAAVPLIVAGQPRRVALSQARELLERLGIGSRCNLLPKDLSGGQQQRVALARALIHQPRLLICDEPTAALDARSGKTVMELLQAVALEPDRAVIVVTHDTRVYSFGDTIVHMNDGIVTHTTDAHNLTLEENGGER